MQRPIILQRVHEEGMQEIYEWIDKIPTLSKPKKNINRDFADAVMLGQVIKYFYPKLVDMHNYIVTTNFQQKCQNWQLLNKKVLCKLLGGSLQLKDIEDCANAVPGAIEEVLFFVKQRLPSVPNPHMSLPPTVGDGRETKAVREEEKERVEPNTQSYETTIALLEEKCGKLEQLVQIKDLKIKTLQDKLQQLGVSFK